MERSNVVEHRGTSLQWDPPRARLEVVYGEEALDAADAEALMPVVTSWVDATPRFTILVDANRLRVAPLGWRRVWMGWFSQRRDRMRAAIYGAGRLDSLTIPVFAGLTGAQIRTFDDRASAEAWLAETARVDVPRT